MLGRGRLGVLRVVYTKALDWLFPPRCAGCKRLGSTWCSDCQDSVRQIRAPYCLNCGSPLENEKECQRCKHEHFAFDAARSWAAYEGNLRQAILSLKSRRNESLAAQLTMSLATVVNSNWKADLLVPVPLAPQRLAQRGFNQAELLATSMGDSLGLTIAVSALTRPHETSPQVGLNPTQRRKNLRGAFTADPNLVRDKSILVLDDIMTTGSTLDAAAHALKQSGARKVFAVSLARTLLESERMFW